MTFQLLISIRDLKLLNPSETKMDFKPCWGHRPRNRNIKQKITFLYSILVIKSIKHQNNPMHFQSIVRVATPLLIKIAISRA